MASRKGRTRVRSQASKFVSVKNFPHSLRCYRELADKNNRSSGYFYLALPPGTPFMDKKFSSRVSGAAVSLTRLAGYANCLKKKFFEGLYSWTLF